jgi:hypothetical protein
MRLLAWLAQGQKLSAIPYAMNGADRVLRGRISDLPFRKGTSFSLGCESDLPEWNQLSMRITLREDGLHIVEESLTHSGASVPLYHLDQPSSGRGTDVSVAYNNFARGGKKPRLKCSDQLAVFTQLTTPAPFDSGHLHSKEVIPETALAYERWLSTMLFLDPVPAAMREYSFPSEKRLRGDGSNLSGVLYNLWGAEGSSESEPFKQQRSDVLSFIQSLPEQDISGLAFLHEPRGGVMVSLSETFGGNPTAYDASLLSDGTLRVLAIAAAMLTAEEGSLVVIEEIDNGVHPSRARRLLERIRSIAERRKLRVLLSTHNPALMDALPDSALPAVVFCYRDPNDGGSRLMRLQDVPDYPELIAQGSLGELVTTELLERFVKQHRTDTERKARARAWLQQVRAGASE